MLKNKIIAKKSNIKIYEGFLNFDSLDPSLFVNVVRRWSRRNPSIDLTRIWAKKLDELNYSTMCKLIDKFDNKRELALVSLRFSYSLEEVIKFLMSKLAYLTEEFLRESVVALCDYSFSNEISENGEPEIMITFKRTISEEDKNKYREVYNKLRFYQHINRLESYVLFEEGAANVAPSHLLAAFLGMIFGDGPRMQVEFDSIHIHCKNLSEDTFRNFSEAGKIKTKMYNHLFSTDDYPHFEGIKKNRARIAVVGSQEGLNIAYLTPDNRKIDGFSSVGPVMLPLELKKQQLMLIYLLTMKRFYAKKPELWDAYVAASNGSSHLINMHCFFVNGAKSTDINVFFYKLTKFFVAYDLQETGLGEQKESLLKYIKDAGFLTDDAKNILLRLLQENNFAKLKEVFGLVPSKVKEHSGYDLRDKLIMDKTKVMSFFIPKAKMQRLDQQTNGEFFLLSEHEMIEFILLTGRHFVEWLRQNYSLPLYLSSQQNLERLSSSQIDQLRSTLIILRNSSSLNEARKIAKEIDRMVDSFFSIK